MWDIITALLGLFTGSSSTLVTAVTAMLALIGIFFRVKAVGRKEARNESTTHAYKEALQSARIRQDIEEHVDGLSDAELNRLRSQYESR